MRIQQPPPPLSGRAMVATGALAVMAALGFGRFGYTMLLPATRDGLGLNYTCAGLLGTANLAGYLLGSIAAGLLPRWSPRALATSGLTVVALALGWMGHAHGSVDAVGARFLAGVAAAVVYVQALALVAGFPRRAKGLASGIMHTGNGLGLILTGLGVPLVVAHADGEGWRSAWLALAFATMVIAPLPWLFFQPRPTGDPPSLRQPLRASGHDHTSLATYGGLYALFGLSYIIYMTFFAESLRARGLALSDTGLAWALVGLFSLGSGLVWGTLSDRMGRRLGFALLFGFQAIAYLVFLIPAFWSLTVSVVLFGATAWGIPAIMAAAVTDGRSTHGATAFGVVTSIMSVGQAAGPLLAGISADLTGMPQSGIWISVVAALAGGLWSLRGASRRRGWSRIGSESV